MKFLEDNTDFINFDNDEDEDTYIATCHECKEQFVIHGDEEPESCPNCDIEFIPQG